MWVLKPESSRVVWCQQVLEQGRRRERVGTGNFAILMECGGPQFTVNSGFGLIGIH